MAYQAAMTGSVGEQMRKGPWLPEEDELLTTFVTLLGERRWDSLARASCLRRSGKSCRLRWMNYLRPNLKHGPFSLEEERIIVQLQEQWGNKWSKIARMLPGRTDNEIKNYWRAHLKKKIQVESDGDWQCNLENPAEQGFYQIRDMAVQNNNLTGRDYNEKDSCWAPISIEAVELTTLPHEACQILQQN